MGKKLTSIDMLNKIKLNHPFSQIEILSFSSIKEPMTYKCCKCGKAHLINKAEAVLQKLNVCDCHQDFNSRAEKIRYFESNDSLFEVLEIKRANSTVHCLNCDEVFNRTTVSLMSNFHFCPFCDNRHMKLANNLQEALAYLDMFFEKGRYKLLEYNTFHSKCRIKDTKCKFVFTSRYDGFLNSRGCPKCERGISRGELKIKDWLAVENIDFIPQKSLNLEETTKRFKLDFFLPKYNLAIEYNGEQHYIDKHDIFDSLKITQQRDNIKIEYCKRHNIELLIIPYWDLNNIPIILSSRFND